MEKTNEELIFEKAYGGGDKWHVAHSLDYGKCGEMAEWVYDQFEAFYGPQKEE